MKKIMVLIEGDGELRAVPRLISRILDYKNLTSEWIVTNPMKINNLGYLNKKIREYLEYAEKQSSATLILLDLDDGCPKEEAQKLAKKIKSLNITTNPVSIVFAHREYEAWFLASMDTIAGKCEIPAGIKFTGDAENIRSAKDWISKVMYKEKQIIYKETLHQFILTGLIDINVCINKSRSFRRLMSAIDNIVEADKQSSIGQVTP